MSFLAWVSLDSAQGIQKGDNNCNDMVGCLQHKETLQFKSVKRALNLMLVIRLKRTWGAIKNFCLFFKGTWVVIRSMPWIN